MEPYLEAGEAIVLADGIRYLGRSYTLRAAIKEQWFMKAQQDQPWRIAVYCEVHQFRLYVKVNEEYCLCQPILHEVLDQARIHKEMQLFRQLKEQWRMLRSGNKPMDHFPGKRSNR